MSNHTPQWYRVPEHDKRLAWGDDYAGDAWRNVETGEIKWVAVNSSRMVAFSKRLGKPATGQF